MYIQTVNVCGAGVMGMGISQALAQFGMPVRVMDTDMAIIERSLGRTRSNLQMLIERGKITREDADAVLSRINPTTNIQDITDADLIIEAVFESMEVKKKVFADLDAVLPERTIIASNTSILSPTEMGSATKRPDRCVGMHWMNPAPVMKLIEVTAGMDTSGETVDAVIEFARRIGKVPVRISESPGGIASRILSAMRNAAVDILVEGVATAEDIDTAMKLGAGFPMGPLELIDLVGVDIHTINSDTLYRELSDPRYRPNAYCRKMLRAGHLGRKSGRGFYRYEQK